MTRADTAFDGRIDFLVNIAAASGPLGSLFWENTLPDFAQIMTLNVTGCFLTMLGMIARGYGRIVNVGGAVGLRGRSGRAAYSASK